MTSGRHVPTVEELADDVAAADRAVVEPSADVAVPMAGPAPDAVATVAPMRARVDDGERSLQAREVAGGSAREGQLETIVEDVPWLVEPAATHALPALPAERRTDPGTVADADGAASDALLSVGVE